jgi:3-hydroxy-9,10-secoandrosta-1,3,5(10)-triene-9,17-dione monooxygenase
MMQPKRYGGYEFDYGVLIDACAELGRGCGSTTWVVSNIVARAWTWGMAPPQGQDDLWADDPDVLTSSSWPTATAKVTKVDGGLVLDGTWSFASGVDLAEWNMFNAFLPRPGGGLPIHHFVLVPKADYEVVDDWFVTGLIATGSKSTVIRNVFVPQHRILSTEDCRGGPTPGSAVNPSPLYRLSMWASGVKLFSAPVLGIARGALDAVEEDLTKRIGIGGAKIAELQSAQMRFAEADGDIDAAWALLQRDNAEAMRLAANGQVPDQVTRVRWRRNDALATRMCVRAVEMLHPLMGGRGLVADSFFQRQFRDVHAASSQLLLAWDPNATLYGRVRLGLAANDPRI